MFQIFFCILTVDANLYNLLMNDPRILHLKLHCVSKKDNDVLRYNINAHQPISIIFGRDIAE